MSKTENISIWDSFNFDKIDKEVKENLKSKKSNKYLKIVKKVVKDIVGKSSAIEVELNERKSGDFIEVLISRSVTDCRFDFLGDNFLLYGHDGAHKYNGEDGISFEFNDEKLFESIVMQSIEKSLIPEIKSRYKKGRLKSLPSKLKKEKISIDLKKLTPKWLTNKFYEISNAVMNGETIENVDIKIKNNTLNCSFDIDCDRYGHFKDFGNISINKHGSVVVSLDDTPLEGCGMENELSFEIENLIKK